jgi:thioredoxin 1
MQEITTTELKTKMQSGENFVLDLYATWCGPCKIMLNNLQKVNESLLSDNFINKNYNIYKLDIDTDREFVMEELGIRSVPTIKFYKDGKEFMSKVGLMSTSEVLDVISKN